jgi:hypothetical protein
MGISAKMKRKSPSRTGGRGPLAIDAVAARDAFTFGGHRLPSLYRLSTLPRTG